jgi:predicted RNase H-like HicB family nuclease
MKTTITALVLLTITLLAMTIIIQTRSSPAEATTEDDLEARVASLEDAIDLHLEELRVHEDHILALEDRATRLEELITQHVEVTRLHDEKILALEAIQWREPGKVSQAVVDRLWERASSCRDDDDCYYGDPLLYAFYSIPYEDRHAYVTKLIVEGTFYAVQTDPAHWTVTAQYGDDKPFTFLVDTTYHAICWDQSQFCAGVDFTNTQ